MRKFIIALALLLTTFFVISRFTEIQEILKTFEQGDWRFLALALVVQAVWLVNQGASYRIIFRILGIQEGLRHMIPLAAAANFLNVVAPTGGMSVLAVFISDAHKRGYSSARATISGALYLLFDYTGFLLVLGIGLALLSSNKHLRLPEIIASILLFLFAAAVAFLLYLGTRSASRLGAVLEWLAKAVNRVLRPFIHRSYLAVERASAFASEAADGLSVFKDRPRALITPFIFSIGNKALLITVLFLVFLAFKVTFSIETLIAGFSIGYLFLIVSPTPSGLGVVEGVLTLSLKSLGMHLEDAAVVVLAYRGITLWVPFFFGMAAFRFMTRGQKLPVQIGPEDRGKFN